jgi:hypothetical protein
VAVSARGEALRDVRAGLSRPVYELRFLLFAAAVRSAEYCSG